MGAIAPDDRRSLAVLAMWLAGWAIVINLALLGLAQTPVLDWLPDRQTGTGFVTDNRERIAGALADYRAGRVARGDYLVAVTGISNVREAVDVDIVRTSLGDGVRVLGVAGAGAGAPSIVENADTLLNSPLRPDVVVLGIAPLQLVDTLVKPGVLPAGMPALTIRERVRNWVKQGFWLFGRRNDINISVDRALLEGRGSLFETLGVTLATPNAGSPWRPMLRVMGAEHFPESNLRAGLDWAKAVGVYDRSTYQRATAAPAMVAQLVRAFRAKGAEVIVIVTPEHSWLRSREPVDVMNVISERLRRESGASNLPVYDFRAAVPDDGFVDLSHLNSSGAKAFSEILGPKIGNEFRDRSPLMAASTP